MYIKTNAKFCKVQIFYAMSRLHLEECNVKSSIWTKFNLVFKSIELSIAKILTN